MTPDSGILIHLKYYNGQDKIIIENGSKIGIKHVEKISKLGLKLKEVSHP